MKIVTIDEGINGRVNSNDLTRIDEGFMNPLSIVNLPGECGEHLLFNSSQSGRMSKDQFDNLVDSLSKGWDENKCVTIHVEHDGKIFIHEGNHRIRAAIKAGIDCFVEIKYFGNSQRIINALW
jgi:hypothetical protein